LLASHRSSVQKTNNGWRRQYPFIDLDHMDFLETKSAQEHFG